MSERMTAMKKKRYLTPQTDLFFLQAGHLLIGSDLESVKTDGLDEPEEQENPLDPVPKSIWDLAW